MAVFRVHKTKDFTVMSNHHLRDNNLTLKAKGLLSVILSLPDDWKYSITGLAAICKEGTSAVKSALQELTDAGYVTVTKLYPNQTETGRIEYIYDIHERPQIPRKQGVENLPLKSQQVENNRQLNTDNKELKNKDTDKAIIEKRKAKRFTPPKPEEVNEYMTERGTPIDAERFCDYYESVGWMRGKTKLKDWRAAARQWARNDARWGKKNGVTWDADLEELAAALDF